MWAIIISKPQRNVAYT